jgi:RNA polymerase sigma factor (sigma-70 family)
MTDPWLAATRIVSSAPGLKSPWLNCRRRLCWLVLRGNTEEPLKSERSQFVTTHWSVVLAAADRYAPDSQEALSQLYSDYFYPLYAFIRRRGNGPPEAEDLVQEFFARLLEKGYLANLKREGGRFRSFLLTALKHFLANQWEQARTQKRGGGQRLFALDELDAEGRYQLEPVEHATPESLYERRWAFEVLDHVRERLRLDYTASNKSDLFQQLEGFVSGDRPAAGYAEIAASQRISEGAVKVAVHRLRQRYGELLREEIARTVSAPEEVEQEIRYLITVASR